MNPENENADSRLLRDEELIKPNPDSLFVYLPRDEGFVAEKLDQISQQARELSIVACPELVPTEETLISTWPHLTEDNTEIGGHYDYFDNRNRIVITIDIEQLNEPTNIDVAVIIVAHESVHQRIRELLEESHGRNDSGKTLGSALAEGLAVLMEFKVIDLYIEILQNQGLTSRAEALSKHKQKRLEDIQDNSNRWNQAYSDGYLKIIPQILKKYEPKEFPDIIKRIDFDKCYSTRPKDETYQSSLSDISKIPMKDPSDQL